MTMIATPPRPFRPHWYSWSFYTCVWLMSGSRAEENDGSESSPLSQCSLYLAPSSIEGAGLGTFTAKEIAAGQQIGEAEIVHNVFDLPLHQSPAISDECNISDYDWLGDDYQAQTEARRVLSLVP